jgi:hypothetical protein
LGKLNHPFHDIYSPGEVDSTEGASPRSRIIEIVRVAGSAIGAAMVCSPMIFAAHPKTPLRVLGITTFEYLARLRGGTLGRRRRHAMALACDYGSLRDDYYDRERIDVTELRSLRRRLRVLVPEAATRRFIQQLRHAERNRPVLAEGADGIEDAAIAYRTRVLDLILKWLNSISGLSVDPVKYHSLLDVACLLQLADDLLDWKEDQALQCPSYVTAFLRDRPSNEVVKPLRTQADALLHRTVVAARQDAGGVPFAAAAALTWTFIITLLRVGFSR